MIFLLQNIAQGDWGGWEAGGGREGIALTGVCVCQNVLATAMLLTVLVTHKVQVKHTQGTVLQKQCALNSPPPFFTNQRLSHLIVLSALLS